VESTAAEVAKLKEVQQAAMAEQMQLDEASLQRLHAEQAAAKVAPLLHAVREEQRTQLQAYGTTSTTLRSAPASRCA